MKVEERFEDIRNLYETNRITEARKYLTLGWRLLKVMAKREEGECICYVLGWPSDQAAQYPMSDNYHSPRALVSV